jgi:hypothetical protein
MLYRKKLIQKRLKKLNLTSLVKIKIHQRLNIVKMLKNVRSKTTIKKQQNQLTRK